MSRRVAMVLLLLLTGCAPEADRATLPENRLLGPEPASSSTEAQ